MSTKSQLKISIRHAALFLCLSTAACAGTAHANQCGDISLALTATGDNYYDVDNPYNHSKQKLSMQQMLLEQSNVFKQLRNARFTNGTGERTRCFGTENNWRTETSPVELRDIYQKDYSFRGDSELMIDALEYNKADERLRQEFVYFSSTKNTDISATADGNALKLNTRRRQATLIGSNLRETAVSAVSTDHGIDIKQSIFVNGHLAEWFSWTLNSDQ